MECLTLGNQVFVESEVVVAHYLLDNRHFLTLGLQDNEPPLALTTGTATDLRHHHKGMFVGTEIGIVKHGVGVQNPHHTDLVEIEPLADHLRTNQDVGAPCPEIHDNALVGIASAGGVEIHTRHMSFRKHLAHLLLNLLSTKTTRMQLGRAATGTLRGHSIGVTTIMTRQLVHLPMIGQRHVAMLTMGHPPTLFALNHRGKATTVLKQDGLFPTFKGLAHLI